MKSKEKKMFPLFVDLTEKKILVVGAGKIASRRVKTLLPFAGEITVEAPEAAEELLDLAEKGEILYRKKAYAREDLYDADMVIAATDSREVNEDIYSACKCLGIQVNVASDQNKCDFHFPGILEYDGVVMGFNGSNRYTYRYGRSGKRSRKPCWEIMGRYKMRKVVIGSRESRLAVIQSEIVKKYIEEQNPDIQVEILTMKTTGDIILDKTLDKVGGKGLFVKELDKALMDKRSDISVHSLKDMPMEVPAKLPLAAYSRREDPRDALVLPKGRETMDKTKPIGCSSLRRILQLKEIFPDMEFKSVRGNVLTRLKKLDEGEYGALVLAAAGLKRLGLEDRISRYFTVSEIIPAAGQGILAVQGRAGEDFSYLAGFQDSEAAWAATAERAFVRYLDGGCSSPVAAHGQVQGDELYLLGLYYDEETGKYKRGSKKGSVSMAEELGISLARELREACQKENQQ